MMRRLAPTLALAASIAVFASLAPGSPATSACAAAGPNHAAVIVEHGDGSVVTRCVAFEPNQVTGEQLLNASGISWSGQTFGGFGDAVCAVDGEPAGYTSCPGKDSYWAVFVARGNGAWQLANVGISTLTVSDGDAEGFRYVPSSGVPAAPPRPTGVCAVLASPVATPAPAATPAAGATSTATAVVAATPQGTASSGDTGATASAFAGTPASLDPALAAVPGSTGSAGPGTPVPYGPGQNAATAPGPTPPPGSGVDLGLLAAAVAGGGLGGLAMVRMLAARRRVR
jgi:hypothetical protein